MSIQLVDDLKTICLNEDINIYLRSQQFKPTPESTLSLSTYKSNVKRGRYRFRPIRELKILTILRDNSEAPYTRADWRYLEQRYRKVKQHLISPTPYQRAHGSEGGKISIWEKTQYEGFKIAQEISLLLGR